MSEKFLTPPEAAELIKISTSTLAKRRLFGGGPIFVKVGRKVLYREADLIAWVNSKTFGSTSEYSKAGA